MEFEKSLRSRLHLEVLKRIEKDFMRRWNEEGTLEEILQDIKFDSVENAYSIYIENKMNNATEEQLFEICGKFERDISSRSLMKLKRRTELAEQEKSYIRYKEQGNWRKYGWSESYW